MAEISIGRAVGEGFDLVRQKPLLILAWGAIQVAVSALSFMVFAPFFISGFSQAFHTAATPGAPPDPAMVQQLMRAQSISYLIDLISLCVATVINCAVFRSVLHPEQSRFAYLRVGAAEGLLLLTQICLFFGFFIGVMVAMIPVFIVIGVLAAMHAAAAAVIIAIAGGVAAVVGVIYLALRLSLIGPMTVDDGRLHLTDAWALTRGRVASLLAVALVLLLALLAIEIVVGLVLIALGMGMLSSLAGGFSHLQTFFQQPASQILSRAAPMLIVIGLIYVPLTGGIVAIVAAPWARAYRDLRPAGDISETFA